MFTTNLPFSWKAVVLAPMAVPLFAALTLSLTPGGNPGWSFVFFFGLGCVFSYGVSLGLFLPGLLVLSRFTRLTAWLTGLVGMALGLVVYVPVAWQSYAESGDNSGPPTGSFAEHLWHEAWSESWIFFGAGLVTATLYWLLSVPRRGPAN